MKRARKIVAIAVIVTIGAMGTICAQGFSLDWHGFVNPHYYADSRSVVGGREDMMLFYPKPILLDSLGNDINDGWQANMLAITARLGLTINGPDIWGAKAKAYIEGDFTGSTNATIDHLRLRHAYIDMLWENRRKIKKGDREYDVLISSHRLLAGQYWYPMVIHEIMPMTNPLNMGAPFHCYARQPQVRYEYYFLGLEAVAVASWQLDNMSQGLLNGAPASSTLFARHSLVPELNAQLRIRGEKIFYGVAINIKTIQPQVQTVYTAVQPSADLYTSFSWSLFGKANIGPVTVKAQTLLNNSLYEGCSLGGYLMLADSTFQDWHFNTVWLDIERNKGHWRPGLFMGYAKNIDYGHHADALYTFGRGHDIDYLWRVQPRLTYTTGNGLSFTGEAEYTRAGYKDPVGNLRLSLSMVYAF
ncbi:MAG: hypothetical protein J6W88_00570 [Bacteroidales bacterium]|nr:hypothetical protein [Bacteroidales bacterium]